MLFNKRERRGAWETVRVEKGKGACTRPLSILGMSVSHSPGKIGQVCLHLEDTVPGTSAYSDSIKDK